MRAQAQCGAACGGACGPAPCHAGPARACHARHAGHGTTSLHVGALHPTDAASCCPCTLLPRISCGWPCCWRCCACAHALHGPSPCPCLPGRLAGTGHGRRHSPSAGRHAAHHAAPCASLCHGPLDSAGVAYASPTCLLQHGRPPSPGPTNPGCSTLYPPDPSAHACPRASPPRPATHESYRAVAEPGAGQQLGHCGRAHEPCEQRRHAHLHRQLRHPAQDPG